jgi:hypothetical protein
MRFLFKLLIAFLILILAAAIYRDYFPANKPYPASHVLQAPIVDEVIAIGLNAPSEAAVTSDNVKNGTYPILALRITGNQYIVNIVTRMGPLWRFDKTHDGLINNSDPIYSQLVLAYINPNSNTVRFMSLQRAGIQAIIVDTDPKHRLKLADRPQGLPPGYWHAHSQVIMSDGSIWRTDHIPLPTTYLDSLKTEPNSKYIIIPSSQ